MKSFIDAVTNDPIKIGMIGPIFSQQTEVLAQTAGFYHLVEVRIVSLYFLSRVCCYRSNVYFDVFCKLIIGKIYCVF